MDWERLSVVDLVGKGRNSKSYLVFDGSKPKILKVLHPGIDPNLALERFLQISMPRCDWLTEFVAAWITPNQQLACLRDYRAGLPLNIYCRTQPVANRLKIFRRIFEQLETLHSFGVTHGNLASSNVLVDEKKDQVHFLDCQVEQIAAGHTSTPKEDKIEIETLYRDFCLPEVILGTDLTQSKPLDF